MIIATLEAKWIYLSGNRRIEELAPRSYLLRTSHKRFCGFHHFKYITRNCTGFRKLSRFLQRIAKNAIVYSTDEFGVNVRFTAIA